MLDVANGFAQRCFVVYAMLLPAHGVRPAEMLDVKANDWLAAARFGIESLKG
jgi:esterase/lipase